VAPRFLLGMVHAGVKEQRDVSVPLRFGQRRCVVDDALHAILAIVESIDALDREGRLVGLASDSSN
jgi:hypothetical protein